MGIKFGNLSMGTLSGDSSINLADLHDVDITNPETGDILQYDENTLLWKNASLDSTTYTFLESNLIAQSGIVITPNPGSETLTFSLGNITPTSVSTNLITMTGTGARIKGDFSHATRASRVLFQSSAVNGSTGLGLIPNGTSTNSSFDAYNSQDPDNASVSRLVAATTATILSADRNGLGGVYYPIALRTSGIDALTIETNGDLTINRTGTFLRAPMSNADNTLNLRIQSSTVDGYTVFGVLPNGTGTTAGMNCYNNSNIANTSYLGTLITSTNARLSSGALGSGTVMPLQLITQGGTTLVLQAITAEATLAGSLNITGTGRRIQGDFSSATQANRVFVETSTVNGNTSFSAKPNGTGTVSDFIATSSSDATNSSRLRLYASVASTGLVADFVGTGAYQPINFSTGGSASLTIGTDGVITAPKGVLNVSNSGSSYITNRCTGVGGVAQFEALGARNDANTTFQGRYGAAFRRSDGIAIANSANLGSYLFGAQFGNDATYQPTKVRYPASITGMSATGSTFADANNMATDITFRTGAVGDAMDAANVSYGTEKMRITHDGKVLIGSAFSSGIGKFEVFGGATYASGGIEVGNTARSGSNLLDWYEEGSFTPVAFGSTVAGTCTYTGQVGRYTRIGNKVYVQFTVAYTGHTGTGALRVGGLPFASAVTAAVFAVYINATTGQSPATSITPYLSVGATQLVFEAQSLTSGGSPPYVIQPALPSMLVSGSYQV